ncbi:hypothetical protein L1887_25118 [Cichorium endivia]|nr:hypothetical protein L1887_25118 [Cichorium endivia]
MSSSRQIMFLLACSCWWLVSNCNSISKKPQDGSVNGVSPPGACENCSLCQYPCTPQPRLSPPQLPGGSEIYTAPPPPQLPGGSDINVAPPPPVGVNCPPVAPVICCQNSPPMPYTYPNNNYGNYSESSRFSSSPCSLMLLLLLPSVFLFNI